MIGWWAGLLMWGQGASTDFGTAMYVIYAFALLAGAGGVSSARPSNNPAAGDHDDPPGRGLEAVASYAIH